MLTFKVRTSWETHKIWKNLPHGFVKSADLLSKRQNHEDDFLKFRVCFSKSPNYTLASLYLSIMNQTGSDIPYLEWIFSWICSFRDIDFMEDFSNFGEKLEFGNIIKTYTHYILYLRSIQEMVHLQNRARATL